MIRRYLIYLFILICVLIWQHVEFTRLSYKESTLMEELHTLRERNRALRIEIARLKSPSRIEEISKRLGLVPAKRVVLIDE